MNSLIRLRTSNLKSSILFNQQNVQALISRSISNTKPVLAGFAKDYKPGPYPMNEKEKIAAAQKYGLRPEDYEPFPDDGFGFGDYPKLAPISTDMKSDWDNYDDHYLKRHFGEPVMVTQEQITAEKVTLKPLLVSFPKILFWFFLGSGLYLGLNWALWEYKCFVPVTPKQYPRDVQLAGEKHYKI